MIACSSGSALAAQVRMALAQREQWQLQPVDLLAILLPLLRIFDACGIPCYLEGSIASSLHGMQQLAQDIDLVIEYADQDLPALLALLKQQYVFEEEGFREAVDRRTACSIIHLDTLMKVDVILAKQATWDVVLRQRIAPYHLDESSVPVRVASVEEMLLVKLRWYSQDVCSRTDGMSDDAGWNDIVGMLKVQGPVLERTLLEQWARTFCITEWFRQALVDADMEQEEAV
jgi:hypothetical protein